MRVTVQVVLQRSAVPPTGQRPGARWAGRTWLTWPPPSAPAVAGSSGPRTINEPPETGDMCQVPASRAHR